MSDQQSPKRPSHYAYQVNDGQDGKSYFNKIGAAFAHKDGEGYNIALDSVPVDGRITLRTPQERVQEVRSESKEPAKARRLDQGREQ